MCVPREGRPGRVWWACLVRRMLRPMRISTKGSHFPSFRTLVRFLPPNIVSVSFVMALMAERGRALGGGGSRGSDPFRGTPGTHQEKTEIPIGGRQPKRQKTWPFNAACVGQRCVRTVLTKDQGMLRCQHRNKWACPEAEICENGCWLLFDNLQGVHSRTATHGHGNVEVICACSRLHGCRACCFVQLQGSKYHSGCV